jgi:hydrogenase nickel incorporation protein HypA/HybF
MHELSVASAILNTVLRHADERRVTRVSMRIGELRQVVPESLEFYFGIVTRDTVCENAVLELEHTSTRLHCRDCELEWEPSIPAFRCPRCESPAAQVIAGEELEVQYIEVEEQEPACTGPR